MKEIWPTLENLKERVKTLEQVTGVVSCNANGPNMLKSEDAIWGWNQFVSHRGKVLS